MLRTRAVVGVAGELLVTAGVIVLLFVVWQLGWVAVVEGRRQQGTVQALERDFTGSAQAPARLRTPAPRAPARRRRARRRRHRA